MCVRKKFIKELRNNEMNGKSILFGTFSGRETIQKYVLKILLRNSKNWLSYS